MHQASVTWLARHPGLVFFIYSVVTFTAIIVFLLNRTDTLAEESAIETATIVARTISEFRSLYTSEVVERVRPLGVEISHEYVERPQAIPLPATLSMELARLVGEGDDYGPQVQLYSPYPFPWREATGGLTDEFARRAWEVLRSDPTTPYVAYGGTDDERVLRYATADVMGESCVPCHNTRPDSPKRDWVTGDVRGVLEVAVPMARIDGAAASAVRLTATLLGGLALLGLSLLVLFVREEQRTRKAERSVAVANAKARVAAEAANRAKSRFLGTMSHELRTPLNAVIGYSEMLIEDLSGTESVDDLHRIQASGEHLLALVTDVLDVSKIDAGEVALHPERFDIEPLIREVVDGLRSAFEANESEFSVDLEQAPHTMTADPVRVTQILTNLLSNASKFARAGRVSLEVLAADTDVVFSVRDDGVGIASDQLEHIFDLFRKAPHTTTREFAGTGLGLFIARDLAVLMGGTLDVESTLGEGATFVLRIPIGLMRTTGPPSL